MASQYLSYANDREFLDPSLHISETLSCLTDLLCIDAENPDRVRLNPEEAQERVRALASLLRSSGCDVYFSLCP